MYDTKGKRSELVPACRIIVTRIFESMKKLRPVMIVIRVVILLKRQIYIRV